MAWKPASFLPKKIKVKTHPSPRRLKGGRRTATRPGLARSPAGASDAGCEKGRGLCGLRVGGVNGVDFLGLTESQLSVKGGKLARNGYYLGLTGGGGGVGFY